MSSSSQRPLDVAHAMKRCVLRKGLDGTTLRDIGREAGFTTGMITHYFSDKAAVVQACFEIVSSEWIGDVEARLSGAASTEDRLAELVRIALPLDEESQHDWRLWAEMWTYAGTNPEFAHTLEQIDARWERQVLGVLREAHAAKLLRARVDLEAEANILVRLIDGLGMRSWLTGDWDGPRRQLAHQLASLLRPSAFRDELLERAERARAEHVSVEHAPGVGVDA